MAYSGPVQADELQELIQGCARNERAAQEKVYHLFYGRMMAVVRRYIDQQEQAEEVLNNGFLRAFQRVGQYNFKGTFEGWLRKIMFHCVSDYVKVQVNQNNTAALSERDEAVSNEVASKLYYNQLLELVQALPQSTRFVFNMFVLEGFSHREIAKMLNISVGTSKWHLNEGRKQLKDMIEKLGLQYKY